jgi:uncharacterized membrane protein
MNEQETPQAGSPQEGGEPSSPESPATAAPQPGAKDSNRSLMIVLSYLWILFLVPLLVEKEDSEVQWHAKHGLVLTVLEILVQLVLNVITVTGIGCIFALFIPLVFLGFAVIRLVCIVKGLAGERFLLPGVSQYADRF